MTVPVATYRLQLHAGFTLEDAGAVCDYLASLGISHVYVSPILQAAAGSTHGYDCCDPLHIDRDRGGEAGWRDFRQSCTLAGLGTVVDVVPNHLDTATDANAWWMSVLRFGRASPFARYFDIEWDRQGHPALNLPVLGQGLDEALESGLLQVVRGEDGLMVSYGQRRFPLRPTTEAEIVERASALCEPRAATEVRIIAQMLRSLEAKVGGRTGSQRDDDTCAVAGRFAAAMAAPESLAALDSHLSQLNASAWELRRVLEQQHYRLCYWRICLHDLPYRRFFDINTLVGVRVEDAEVFNATHGLILQLVSAGQIDGLRVDHPDGLRDPGGYFNRLRAAAPDAWIVAEKILGRDEALRADWPIAGTTGYDFLNDTTEFLLEPDGLTAVREIYNRFADTWRRYEVVSRQARLQAGTGLLGADLARLLRVLRRLGDRMPGLGEDAPRLAQAVALMAASFDIYRTYVMPDVPIDPDDAAAIAGAHAAAAEQRPDLSPQPLDALRDLLLRQAPGVIDDDTKEFIARFQQYTAPTMAKGEEDTALYRSCALAALNEVGGRPDAPGLDGPTFHARVRVRAASWPHAMLSTSTHDTKRSEDVRARLCVLSEIPEEWERALAEFRSVNSAIRRRHSLDGHMEYLLYQTLVGVWPIDAERLTSAMLKSAREAKLQTSWLEPNTDYEQTLEVYARSLLENPAFTLVLDRFVQRILRPGRLNSLIQTLLKLTCPGVPDVYQGCELWDLSLVDPDNRRPVNYALRRTLLAHARQMRPSEVWDTLDDRNDPGVSKIWLISRVLAARRSAAEMFEHGQYAPLNFDGPDTGRLVGFLRSVNGTPGVAVVLSRWSTQSVDASRHSVELPSPGAGRLWRDVLSDRVHPPGRLAVSALFPAVPLAHLMAEER